MTLEKIGLGVPGDGGQRRGEGGRGPRPPRPGGRQDRRREGGHGRRRCRRGGCVRVVGNEALAPDAVPHLLEVAAGEGMPARHHFVEDHAQRPDIVGFLGRAAGRDPHPLTEPSAKGEGAFGKPLAAVSNSPCTVLNVSERHRHLGGFLRVDFLANGSSPLGA